MTFCVPPFCFGSPLGPSLSQEARGHTGKWTRKLAKYSSEIAVAIIGAMPHCLLTPGIQVDTLVTQLRSDHLDGASQDASDGSIGTIELPVLTPYDIVDYLINKCGLR